MYSAWFRSAFLRVLKFIEVNEGGANFMGEPILQNVWIIWSPLLYFNLKGCIDRNSFIHYISMYSAWFRSTFLTVLKFLQIKDGGSKMWRERILQNLWTIWSSLVYLYFKNFLDSNSLSFITFQCILHDSGVLFLQSWNFSKLKMRDLISGGNQFCRMSELFGPPFCISILKVLET